MCKNLLKNSTSVRQTNFSLIAKMTNEVLLLIYSATVWSDVIVDLTLRLEGRGPGFRSFRKTGSGSILMSWSGLY